MLHKLKKEYYQALLDKDSAYEGTFFVGVKSTGIFCRPSCPARKPKFDHCEFFKEAEQALLAGFRPCKRCHPLHFPHQQSQVIDKLIQAVEKNPEKRWKDWHFRELGIDESTARRQFKKRFGMTFVQYARSRRMGMALKQIKSKKLDVLEAQVNVGYESSSGFRDAFSKIMGHNPSKGSDRSLTLEAMWIDTPLGPMISIANDEALYLLEFVDRRGLEKEVERLRKRLNALIIPGENDILNLTKKEITSYFEGTLTEFSVPLHLIGTAFQKEIWYQLDQISFGEVKSYADLAKIVGRQKAYRAVGSANGANQIAIIVPCHRVIRTDGDLGGYGGKLVRKEFLLQHEKKFKKN